MGEEPQGVGQGIGRASPSLLPSGLRPRSLSDPKDPGGPSLLSFLSAGGRGERPLGAGVGGGVAGKPPKANQGLGRGSVATAAQGSLPPLWLPLRKKKTSNILPLKASLALPRNPPPTSPAQQHQ